jgi:predicted aldo/keto reductase-like oxidoreductase
MEAKMASKKGDLTRRGFISRSLAGVAAVGAAGIAPSFALAEEKEAEEVAGVDILYRELGKTGLKMPIVSMGVMNANNPELIGASYDLGVRMFDTAARYQFGRNEQMVGEAVSELGIRDKVMIATKEWRPAQREGMTAAEAKDKFIKLTEGSLKRLKTDYVDIVYIHSIHNVEELDEEGAFSAMEQLKKDGKVRASGISTHESMAEVINKVVDDKLCDVVLTSINVSMAGDAELLKAIDRAAGAGIGVVAMKTQAGGRRLPNQASLTEYDNATVNQAMLKWVLRNESITTAIPGYTNLEHMGEDFAVAHGLEFTEDEKRFLADNELQLGLGFCRQCRMCMATCPMGADVPALMRTHMYVAQYGNLCEARAALDEVPAGRGIEACRSCNTCAAACSNSVDIGYRIQDLKALLA